AGNGDPALRDEVVQADRRHLQALPAPSGVDQAVGVGDDVPSVIEDGRAGGARHSFAVHLDNRNTAVEPYGLLQYPPGLWSRLEAKDVAVGADESGHYDREHAQVGSEVYNGVAA